MTEAARSPTLLRYVADLAGVACVVGLTALTLTSWPAAESVPSRTAGDSGEELTPCLFGQAGHFHGQLYGAIRAPLDWTGRRLACGGMLRPNGGGLRLVFAAPVDTRAKRLVFVLGIAGDLDLPNGAAERRTNVTIIDERSGRFFATQGDDRCWSTLNAVRPLEPSQVSVAGETYCAGSIPSLNDNASLTIGELHFLGRAKLGET